MIEESLRIGLEQAKNQEFSEDPPDLEADALLIAELEKENDRDCTNRGHVR